MGVVRRFEGDGGLKEMGVDWEKVVTLRREYLCSLLFLV